MASSQMVRRMRPGDLERILEIEIRSFGADAYDRKLFASYLDRCGDLALVVEDRRRRVVGYLIACRRGGRAELVSIAVDPSARSKGAASSLLTSLFRRLRARGVSRLGLMVKASNAAGQALYRKHGFEKIRKISGYYEDGSDGLLMAKLFELRQNA